MVNEKILVRDKYGSMKKFLFIAGILLAIIIILAGVFFFGWFSNKGNEIVLENPLKNIVFENTNSEGLVNYDAVVSQGVMEFNADYINFILAALGVGKLHKSMIGYGNPVIEMNLNDEIWNSELKDGGLYSSKGNLEDEDLIVSMTKEEAVKALLSSDITEFMKNSVNEGNTKIEMVAGKIELGSKGYLSMYSELTGEEVEVEE